MTARIFDRRWVTACFVLITHSIGSGETSSNYPDEGFTEPEQTVRVAASDLGVLASISLREGDRIRAGEPICSLDTATLIAALQAAESRLASEGQIASAKAKLDHRQNHLKQIAALREKTHASNLEVTDAELEVALAQADLQIALDDRRTIEMELLKIKTQLDQRVVTAPIDGIILELPKQVGEAVTSLDSHVATIVSLDRLRVRYFLETESALKLSTGQHVRVSFPSLNKGADAIVDFVSPITDANSGTVRVELMLDNQASQLRAGLRCLMENARQPTDQLRQAETPYRSALAPKR